MDARALLRSHAIHDLRRLVPSAHYLLREHDPQADWELVQPLLQQPVGFELSPREHAAAQALWDLTLHELRFRTVFARAFPVQDYDPNSTPPLADSPGMTEGEKVELDARREASRRSALVYARMVADPVLIEAFRPIEDTTAASAAAATRLRQRGEKITTVRDDAVIAALRARNVDPMKMPTPPLGNTPWPLRESLREDLGLSKAQANESFRRLRKEGRIRP